SQLYADGQHSSITTVKNIATQATKETVTGYTRAMRDRKDRTDIIKTFPRPLLLLAGEQDQGIPADTVREQARLSQHAEAIILPAVGHMGMFESQERCLKSIRTFVQKCTVTS